MPIKDIMRVYVCKYCQKKFTMFDGPNGELIFFPENVMWPVHGGFELIDHLKKYHRYFYLNDRAWFGYDNKAIINNTYRIKEGLCNTSVNTVEKR